MNDKIETGLLVGDNHRPGARVVLSMLKMIVPCRAVREPQNKFDRNAIAIYVSTKDLDQERIRANIGADVPDWFMVGYIDRASASRIAPLIDRDPAISAALDSLGKPVVTFTWFGEVERVAA